MKLSDLELAAKGLLSAEFDKSPIISADLVQLVRSSKKIVDQEFDEILPPLYRFHSPNQWTSILVARTIAGWIQNLHGKKFIDIGCGVGKLCIVLRLLTDLKIFGIEQRPQLVKTANHIIETNRFQNISIIEKNLMDLNWQDYDIFYLFNPFQEHVSFSPALVIDHTINFHRDHYLTYTNKVYQELQRMPRNKIFITFHGYGGKIPNSWALKCSQFVEGGFLSLWVKTR